MLLWFFLGLTLGAVQSAVAVMLLGYPARETPSGGIGVPAASLVPQRAIRARGEGR